VLFAILLLFTTFFLPSPLHSQSATTKILEMKAGPQSLTLGEEGIVRVDLTVKPGFKVAKRPAPKLQLEADSSFEVRFAGFAESASGKDPDYFGVFKPLEVKITPARTAKTGKHSLEGKLTYFYCSERDKYCSRSVDPLLFSLEVAEKK